MSDVSIDEKKLYEIIHQTALEEERSLEKLGEGVFMIPERAFVYNVGKSIAFKPLEVFSVSGFEWLPERVLGNGGPCDLVFEHKDHTPGLVIEFKMRGDSIKCVADVVKLAALDPGKYRRFFCALIDAWPDVLQNDPRIKAIERPPINVAVKPVLESFEHFQTKDRRYANPVSCVVGLWEIVGSANS